MNQTWKDREPAIKALVPGLLRDLVVHVHRAPVTVRMFFCEGVMAIVKYFREHTKGKEIGAAHHVFTILGKHAVYGDRGRMEVASNGERLDIFIEDEMVSISVKSLVMATIEVIHGTAMAAFDCAPVDKTWIFFFYQFEGDATPRPPCEYLITWVEIDSLDLDPARTTRQVIKMITKAKDKVAKQLGVPAKIMLPVDNIITVTDLKREIAEKDKALGEERKASAEKDKVIDEKDKVIDEKDKVINEKDKVIVDLKKRLGMS